jgi:hypothetical protein
MAYRLTYWESGRNADTHYELKNIRLRSVEEVSSLALQHNRPSGTTLITLERTDRQSNIEKIVWETGMAWNAEVIKRPSQTNRGEQAKKPLTVQQVDLLYAGLDAWIDILGDNLHEMEETDPALAALEEDVRTCEDLRENFYDYFVKAEEA